MADPSRPQAGGGGDELAPTMTAGYKAPAKKTMDELAQLDAEDESLRKWKESLGVKAGATGAEPNSKKVIVKSLSLAVAGRDDVVMDISSDAKVSELKDAKPIIIKEGIEYRLKITFTVTADVVSGLKYLHVVKRKGVRVDRVEEMLGSYGPPPADKGYHEKTFPPEEAPSGMLARGTYTVKSKFIDDDGETHLEWEWSFSIKKDWED